MSDNKENDFKPPYDKLISYLAQNQDEAKIKALLTALLTDKEQQDIANRIGIFDLLSQGTTQRDVSKRLGVGIATVSRGAKVMQQHDVSELLQFLSVLKD